MYLAEELNNLIARFAGLPPEQLYDRLCEDVTSSIERLAAFEALMSSAGSKQLKYQAIKSALHCEDIELRSWALPYASLFSSEEVVERVTELASEGGIDRLPALRALTELSSSSALLVARTLLSSVSTDDQLHGILSLTRIGSEQAISILQDFADQSTLDTTVRTSVLLAQLELGDQSVTDELVSLSERADDDERVIIAVVLTESRLAVGCDMIEKMISAATFPQSRLLRYMVSQRAGFDWKAEDWVEQTVTWVARCRAD